MLYAVPVTSHRLTLVIAGALATAVIAFATVLGHPATVRGGTLLAALLGTYALGLGLGWIVLGRLVLDRGD